MSDLSPLRKPAPRSPCINVCTLDPAGSCLGCHRTRAEIAGWVRATADQQWAIVTAAEVRRRGTPVSSVL